MDTTLPTGFAGSLEVALRNERRQQTRYRVRSDQRNHAVMELTTKGFVIEADGRPPLRGYVEIVCEPSLVMRRLAICTWAENGLVGYEFKHDSGGGDAAPDHVRPKTAGLLPSPD